METFILIGRGDRSRALWGDSFEHLLVFGKFEGRTPEFLRLRGFHAAEQFVNRWDKMQVVMPICKK